MPDKKRMNKLTPEAKEAVCLCIATGYNAERIVQHLKENFDITVSREGIHRNYIKNPKWQAKARDLADKLEAELLKHPLSKKINRLNLLREAINESLTWRVRRIYYDKGDELERIEELRPNNVAGLVREARAEIEGDKMNEELAPLTFNFIVGADPRKTAKVATKPQPKARVIVGKKKHGKRS